MSILSRDKWEKLTRKKNLSGAKALEAVNKNGYAIKYVEDQTPEICLAAVKQDGYNLQYVKDQTPEICLAAVKQNWDTLKYVKDQTKEICLAAVRQDGDALKYVEERFLDDDDHEIIVLNGKKYRLLESGE